MRPIQDYALVFIVCLEREEGLFVVVDVVVIIVVLLNQGALNIAISKSKLQV